MLFNQTEAMFEIPITPEKLREAAQRLEQGAKSPLYLRGQILRDKIDHNFCFVFRPETKGRGVVESRESEAPTDTPPVLDDAHKESLKAASRGESILKNLWKGSREEGPTPTAP